MIIPKNIFTKGVGVTRQAYFVWACIEGSRCRECNLVSVSSILPPNLQDHSKRGGLKHLNPGHNFCVIARMKPTNLIDLNGCGYRLLFRRYQCLLGYLSEHHSFGEVAKARGFCWRLLPRAFEQHWALNWHKHPGLKDPDIQAHALIRPQIPASTK